MKCVRGYDLEVLNTPAGYYIGSMMPLDEEDPDSPLCPGCRMTGYMTKEQAEKLLADGDKERLWMAERDCAENAWCAGGSCIDVDEEEVA